MRKIALLLSFTCFILFVKANEESITLTFTAEHTCSWEELDSIYVENLTQGGYKYLYYPDTVLILTTYTNIDVIPDKPKGMHLYQNFPNPFSGKTNFYLQVFESDYFVLNAYDLSGRELSRYEAELEQGLHDFSFFACSSQSYILTVKSSKYNERRIMIQSGEGERDFSKIVYNGIQHKSETRQSNYKESLPYEPGDEFRFTGYATDDFGNSDYDVITDIPSTDEDHIFDIANELPDQPSEITGDESPPSNETGLVYEVVEVSGLTYQWSVPDDWDITDGQGTHSITVTSGEMSINISVVAINDCGESPARSLSECPEFVVDEDDNEYSVVLIGDQCWFSENLRTTTFANGEDVPYTPDASDWNESWSTQAPAFSVFYYNGHNTDGIDSYDDMVEAYGKIYNWYAVDDARGLCPEGWHVPSLSDWNQLESYIIDNYAQFDEDNVGDALKSCRQENSPLGDDCLTDEHPRFDEYSAAVYGIDYFGFNAIPGGQRLHGGAYNNIGRDSSYWTSTYMSHDQSHYISFSYHNGSMSKSYKNCVHGYTVRCVRDL